MGYQHDTFIVLVAARDYAFLNKPFNIGYRWVKWDSSYRSLWVDTNNWNLESTLMTIIGTTINHLVQDIDGYGWVVRGSSHNVVVES